jgi:hypothetical protein
MEERGTLRPFNVDPSSFCLLTQEIQLPLATSPSPTLHAQIAPISLHKFRHCQFPGLKHSLFYRHSMALEPTAPKSTGRGGLELFPESTTSPARDLVHRFR